MFLEPHGDLLGQRGRQVLADEVGPVRQLPVAAVNQHRELPIRADYVGKNLPTSLVERVTVHLTEYDAEDAVLIADKTTGVKA